MRLLVFAAFLFAFVVAGCTSQQPTATTAPPTAVPPTNTPAGDASNDQIATMAATFGVSLPGTLVIPNDAKTPNAPTPVPIVIDDLLFTQTGGIANISLSIELRGDGTIIRDGQTSTVPEEGVQQIASLLDGIHFFQLQGIFTSPAGAGDAYLYSLSVTSPTGSRTVTSQDGMTPPELAQVYDAIRALSAGA
ncbi:MAG: hypothetical protein GC204_02705 [Chloroflexi bacterium]|nr:hypothetical protein [Chloroflexota bacterium]